MINQKFSIFILILEEYLPKINQIKKNRTQRFQYKSDKKEILGIFIVKLGFSIEWVDSMLSRD